LSRSGKSSQAYEVLTYPGGALPRHDRHGIPSVRTAADHSGSVRRILPAALIAPEWEIDLRADHHFGEAWSDRAMPIDAQSLASSVPSRDSDKKIRGRIRRLFRDRLRACRAGSPESVSGFHASALFEAMRLETLVPDPCQRFEAGNQEMDRSRLA